MYLQTGFSPRALCWGSTLASFLAQNCSSDTRLTRALVVIIYPFATMAPSRRVSIQSTDHRTPSRRAQRYLTLSTFSVMDSAALSTVTGSQTAIAKYCWSIRRIRCLNRCSWVMNIARTTRRGGIGYCLLLFFFFNFFYFSLRMANISDGGEAGSCTAGDNEGGAIQGTAQVVLSGRRYPGRIALGLTRPQQPIDRRCICGLCGCRHFRPLEVCVRALRMSELCTGSQSFAVKCTVLGGCDGSGTFFFLLSIF